MTRIVQLTSGAALGAALLLAADMAPLWSQQPPAGTDSAAADVLERHIAALGGRALLTRARTVDLRQDREAFGQVSSARTVEDLATRRLYSRSDGPNGAVELGFDGERVWRKTPFFRGYLSETDPAARAMLNRPPPIYQYRERGERYTRLPNETVDGRELIVLGSTRPDPMGRAVPVKLYFDPKTYLLMRRVEGDAITTTTVFGDYRQVQGRTVAFSTTVQSPQATVSSRVTSVAYDVPVADSLFQYRGDSAASAMPADVVQRAAPSAGPGSVAAASAAARPTGVPELGPADTVPADLRRQTFEQVWRTVNETYWDTTFGGTSWAAVRDRYAPLALVPQRSDEFHRLLNRMVGELGQSHFRVHAPDQVVSLFTGHRSPASASRPAQRGDPGLDLQWLNGQLVVVRVEKDSPAAAAGVRPGFVLSRVQGRSPDEIYRAFRERNGTSSLREEIVRVRAAVGELTGSADSVVLVEMVDERGQSVSRSLARRVAPVSPPTEVESRRLEGGIAYFRFGLFAGDVLPRFREALRGFADAPALIIDLRGNRGGVGDVAASMASLLSEQDGSLGTSRARYETRNHSFKGSGAAAYKGRVIVLVDERSGSAAEVFAAGLQEIGRATVVGVTTAGAVLPSVIALLPTGGALQHAISEYRTPRGTRLEARGVTPSVEAPRPTRETLLAGQDPALELAVRTASDARR